MVVNYTPAMIRFLIIQILFFGCIRTICQFMTDINNAVRTCENRSNGIFGVDGDFPLFISRERSQMSHGEYRNDYKILLAVNSARPIGTITLLEIRFNGLPLISTTRYTTRCVDSSKINSDTRPTNWFSLATTDQFVISVSPSDISKPLSCKAMRWLL